VSPDASGPGIGAMPARHRPHLLWRAPPPPRRAWCDGPESALFAGPARPPRDVGHPCVLPPMARSEVRPQRAPPGPRRRTRSSRVEPPRPWPIPWSAGTAPRRGAPGPGPRRPGRHSRQRTGRLWRVGMSMRSVCRSLLRCRTAAARPRNRSRGSWRTPGALSVHVSGTSPGVAARFAGGDRRRCGGSPTCVDGAAPIGARRRPGATSPRPGPPP
jgi:hypothetical protein